MVKYIASEDVLGDFYKALSSNDEISLQRTHIPRSDVFYVREALELRTGTRYTLDRIERAMYLEGMLKKRDVLDPDRKREWEE